MDPMKKRKIDDNGMLIMDPDAFILTPDDARKITEPLTRDQLSEIVLRALLRQADILDAVRSVADRDITARKLFVRGLSSETTSDKLRALFSSYGELDEAVVILDKATGKSKGFGFVTFKHVDGAIVALKEPSKKLDGRMTVTQLAAAGMSGGGGASTGGGGGGGGANPSGDVLSRKIYVANVPYEMPAERLLQHFLMYGEIEEGPLGFDKITGKSKGFALFVYKTPDSAIAALDDPVKNIDGHQLNCKLAVDGKRGGKPSGGGPVGPMGVQGGNQGNGDGMGPTMPGGQYGGPGGVGGHYGGFSGGVGGPALPGVGNQTSGSNLGGSGGYGGPYGGASHYGGPVGTGYGGMAGTGGAFSGGGGGGGGGGGVGSGAGFASGAGGGYGGVGAGLSGTGRGSSYYSLPPNTAGMGSGDYPQSGHYSISSGGYQGQHNQPAAPRVPPGGAYQGMPPYY